MANQYKKSTTIRLDSEVKDWLYTTCQRQNRSLGNLINTILKREKERQENSLSNRIDKAAEGLPLVNY